MRTANLIFIKADGKAELIARGDLPEVKTKFSGFDLKKGESLELIGTNIEPKRRGGSQDRDAYFAAKKIENAGKLKARTEAARPAPKPDAKAEEKSAANADKSKSPEALRIKEEQASKYAPKIEPKK